MGGNKFDGGGGGGGEEGGGIYWHIKRFWRVVKILTEEKEFLYILVCGENLDGGEEGEGGEEGGKCWRIY